MKNFKSYYLFAFLSFGLFAVGCEKDDDHDHDEDNHVDIMIDEPMDGATIAMSACNEVHVHIDFVASDENHQISVVLHPEGDIEDKILDYSEHDHDKEINFDQEVDLCGYAAGTCFHLEVEACEDHDCEAKATAEAEFCLQ